MYTLTVSDHVMIAHSFRGEAFGPAQQLHGATFVVEAEFRAPALDALNLLVDIGLARRALRAVLDRFDYRNLDTVPAFAGQNTTTEYMAHYIWSELSDVYRAGALGTGPGNISSLKVTLRESPLAWASFEAPLQ